MKEAAAGSQVRFESPTAFRKSLDLLYDAGAWLAALAMMGVLAMVLLSVVGRQVGYYVPGTDGYAGYLMAAAGFLALAHTFKRNEHIRVTLLLSRTTGKANRAIEVWAHSVGVVLAALLAWFSVRLVWVSKSFHDVASTADATPLWIPQLAMAVGAVTLLIALTDDWALHIQGKRRTTEGTEALHHE